MSTMADSNIMEDIRAGMPSDASGRRKGYLARHYAFLARTSAERVVAKHQIAMLSVDKRRLDADIWRERLADAVQEFHDEMGIPVAEFSTDEAKEIVRTSFDTWFSDVSLACAAG